MKKEFKAPIVEVKELSTVNSIMDGGLLISANIGTKGLKVIDDLTVEDYNQWKSNRQ